MYYKLNNNIQLRGWQLLPYALVVKGRRNPIFISAKEMQALQLCNGNIDLSLPLIPQEIRDMIPTIEKNGIIIPCEHGDSIAPEQEYKCYPARYIRTAHWSITGHCNYRCKHKPRKAVFGNNARNDCGERRRRACNLYTAAAQEGNNKAGNNCGVQTLLRVYAGGESQSY